MGPIFPPFRIKKIKKLINEPNVKILDIGAGNHSASITKKWITNCHYTGVDKNKNYNNSESDINIMDNFIELDLTQLMFDEIPDKYYDVIIMSHVIEHLHNGDQILKGLMQKLKDDGIFYIEFPSERSISFPSMKGTLNFFDDSTHCRIYSLKEICNIFLTSGFKIIRARKRRSIFNIMLMPIAIIVKLLTMGHVKGGVFWDLYGFADYVIAKKIRR